VSRPTPPPALKRSARSQAPRPPCAGPRRGRERPWRLGPPSVPRGPRHGAALFGAPIGERPRQNRRSVCSPWRSRRHGIMNAQRAPRRRRASRLRAEYDAMYPKARPGCDGTRRSCHRLRFSGGAPAASADDEHHRVAFRVTERLRQRVTKGAGSRTKALMMAFKCSPWRKSAGES
jgi:hypothetical protein